MRAYPLTRRRQVIRAATQAVPTKIIAQDLQLSPRTVTRWVARWRATGSVEVRRSPGRPRRISCEAGDEIAAMVWDHPTATLATFCELWHQRTAIAVSTATMSRTLRRHGWIKRRVG